MTLPNTPARPPLTDAPSLLAITLAARRIANRSLERAAKRELRDQYGIIVSFRRQSAETEADRGD